MRKTILDLGCGNRKYKPNNGEKVIGVDIDKNSQADIIWDLEKIPYPFKDKSVDIVHMSHVLEHLDEPENCLKEIYRILKKDGIFICKVPHYSSATTVSFLQHKHFFNLAAFQTKPFSKYFKLKKIKLNYSVFRDNFFRKVVNNVLSFFANLHPRFCERFWCYWVGGFSEIEVVLVKK